MQMFHMSSLKMGLDQAVLTGFETGSSGEATMTKEEVERLLRHGAYDIFNEDKAGTAEAESNDFIKQDIDSILERRSRKVVHENTGSGSAAAGGTFSKASFVSKTPAKDGDQTTEEVDINDPDFWKKMVGEAKVEEESVLKPRKRNAANYNENAWDKNLKKALVYGVAPDGNSDSEASVDDSDDSEEDPDEEQKERARWGGQKADNWKRNEAESVLDALEHLGYGIAPMDVFMKVLPKQCTKFSETEVSIFSCLASILACQSSLNLTLFSLLSLFKLRRMSWSMVLMALCEVATTESLAIAKRNKTNAERKREASGEEPSAETGGILAETGQALMVSEKEMKESNFKKQWGHHANWAKQALEDALSYARQHEPRTVDSTFNQREFILGLFYDQLWPSLKGRGWKEDDDEDEVYHYEDQTFKSPSSVINAAVRIHPELQNMIIPLLNKIEQSNLTVAEQEKQAREKDLMLASTNVDLKSLQRFLSRYSPMQLVYDRSRKQNKLSLGRRLLSACFYSKCASELMKFADDLSSNPKFADKDKLTRLASILSVDGRVALPHPLWTKRHDAVLLESISVHGWIEIDKNLKSMVRDDSIQWGEPFQLTAKQQSVQRMGRSELLNVKGTAERAASVLNNHSETLNVLTGFNKKLVIDAYGLTHHEDENQNDEEGKESKGIVWRVDQRLLHQASKKAEPKAQEVVDLPAKKDLVKRAKTVINKSLAQAKYGVVVPTENEPSMDPNEGSEADNHGYTLINQADRCNILLAELVRAICKASAQKFGPQTRLLWEIICEEAEALKAMMVSEEGTTKEAEEIEKICEQIKLAKSAKSNGRQAKNLLRVMIGEKPSLPRSNLSEPMFPDADVIKKAAAAKAPGKKKIKRNDPSLGERSILNAVKKAAKKNPDGKLSRFQDINDDDEALGLPLTIDEVYILRILCTNGIPLLVSPETQKNDLSKPRSWDEFSRSVVNMAKEQMTKSTELVRNAEAEVKKAKSEDYTNAAIAPLQSRLVQAQSEWLARDEAFNQLNEIYEDSPEQLPKKS